MKEDFAQIVADMAQSVAHLIGSEEVTGSIPVISFNEKSHNPSKIKDYEIFCFGQKEKCNQKSNQFCVFSHNFSNF